MKNNFFRIIFVLCSVFLLSACTQKNEVLEGTKEAAQKTVEDASQKLEEGIVTNPSQEKLPTSTELNDLEKDLNELKLEEETFE